MKKVAIIGAGDLGKLITHHITSDKAYEVVGYYDDFNAKFSLIDGLPVLGGTNDILFEYKNNVFDCLLIAIGYRHFNKRVDFFEELSTYIPFATYIHSSCFVDKSCEIGDGTVVLPSSSFDRNVKIGNNVLINTAVTIAHDSVVLNHSFLSPCVAVAGFSTIGSCCNIGINTTVIDNVLIGNNIQTGGGTVVTKDLTKKGLYVGNPARFIR